VSDAESLVHKVVAEAVKFAAVVAVVLGSLAALLPQLNVPASDTAIVAAASAVIAGFLRWAKETKLTDKLKSGL
jgi:hypothetical protein